MWGVNRGIPNEAQDGGGDEPARSCRRQRSSGKDPCRRSWPWSTRTRCWVRRGWSALRFTWPWGSRQRVLLCITDYPVGLQPAIQRVYPGAEWPRCVKHMIRSCLAQVRVQDRGAVVEQLHGVYRAESRREALENLGVAVSPVGGGIQPRCCGSIAIPRCVTTSFPPRQQCLSCCIWRAKGRSADGPNAGAQALQRCRKPRKGCCKNATPLHRSLHVNLDTTTP